MRFSLLVFLLVFLLQPTQLWACRYSETLTPKEKVANAPAVFVGTVVEVSPYALRGENFVKFFVQQSLKGAKDGETFEAKFHVDSCRHNFSVGQRWLYLGTSMPEGSLILEDAYGVARQDNIEFAVLDLGLPKAAQSLATPVFLERLCKKGYYKLRVGEATHTLRDVDGAAKAAAQSGNQIAANLEAFRKSYNLIETSLERPVMGVCADENVSCDKPEGVVTFGTLGERMVTGRLSLGRQNPKEIVFRAVASLRPSCRE